MDEKVNELVKDDDNEKNITFAKFVEVQKHAAKRCGSTRINAHCSLILLRARFVRALFLFSSQRFLFSALLETWSESRRAFSLHERGLWFAE